MEHTWAAQESYVNWQCLMRAGLQLFIKKKLLNNKSPSAATGNWQAELETYLPTPPSAAVSM